MKLSVDNLGTAQKDALRILALPVVIVLVVWLFKVQIDMVIEVLAVTIGGYLILRFLWILERIATALEQIAKRQ